MATIVGELTRLERPSLERHFMLLDVHDRRLRFGHALGDSAISAYVGRIDFELDAVFGVLGDELDVLGAAHLARSSGHAEFGISVLAGHRDQGVGGALLSRAHMRARNWGVRALFMHCLTENAAMLHLARRQGMEIGSEAGESDAWLKLPPGDASSHFGEVFAQRVAVFDLALKVQLVNVRRLAGALTPERAWQGPKK